MPKEEEKKFPDHDSNRGKDSKGKKKGKRGKRNDRDFGNQSGHEGVPDLKKGPNDSKWRCGDEVATKLAANFPFGVPAGLKLDPIVLQPYSANPFSESYTVSGIMTIWTYVTLGNSGDYNSALNLVSREVYSFVRHANSGSKIYEAADQMMVFGAVGQALAMLGWIVRLYRTINEFKAVNRYTPRELIRAQGVDYDDLLANQAQLAWWIRWLGKSINSLSIPNMPYFDACYNAFQNYYIDKDSIKHQVYMLNPWDILCYDPVGSPTGATLITKIAKRPQPGQGTLLSYLDLVTMIHTVMDVLLSDEDVGIICGDVLKAYGDNLYKVSFPTEGVDPCVHSVEMLQQFHNAISAQDMVSSIYYEQNPGTTNTCPYIVENATLVTSTNTGVVLKGTYVDGFSDVPSPEEVVNCTVLQYQIDFDEVKNANNQVTGHKPKAGSLVHDLYLPMYVETITGVDSNRVISSQPRPTRTVGSYYGTFLGSLAVFTNFDWHPLIPILDQNQFHCMCLLGDVQNINFFTYEAMKRIHDTSMLSLFNFNANKL